MVDTLSRFMGLPADPSAGDLVAEVVVKLSDEVEAP